MHRIKGPWTLKQIWHMAAYRRAIQNAMKQCNSLSVGSQSQLQPGYSSQAENTHYDPWPESSFFAACIDLEMK
ncbi:hypothetical protein [Pseudomonas sp. RC10]|uniref:hypothetical protein n=1 Tax=Pseudomonas bambusae TaxID=3139142 RepID=UPI003138996C